RTPHPWLNWSKARISKSIDYLRHIFNLQRILRKQDMQQKTALVISAHAADFVWRAGGAVALYASRGWNVHILCLSFGERGESAKMWKDPTITLEAVKQARRAEAQ